MGGVPVWLGLVALFALSMAAGAAWTIIPAILKARYQTNEIITTLMMSFIGVGLANILIKGPFQDPTVNIPQTRVIDPSRMLPSIPGTHIHVGVLMALGVALIAYYVLTRTSFGLRLHVLGANPRAAAHVGIDVRRLIIRGFLISGALIGAAAAVDVLGVFGYVRANFNPAYGDTVIPFVFLARLNPLAVIPFICFFAVLSTGGDLAATNANVSTDFLLVLVALILLFMTVIEFLGRRRDLGGSYLTPGLRNALRQPLMRRPRARRRGHGDDAVSDPRGEHRHLQQGRPDLAGRRRPARGAAADVHGARRDDLRARRRAQPRPRGDDAARRLHSASSAPTTAIPHGWASCSGALGGMVGASLMVSLCVWLGLDQIVVGIAITLAGEGITSVLQGAEFGSSYPRLGAPSTVGDPAARQDPGGRPEPLRPSRCSSTSASPSRACWSGSSARPTSV